ncbi:hypothetical protein J2851_004905 [Azospirillum rugosum]|uniref:Uncharacterized protein n=1 Tax=Azospirillum rugosum TaxID=416170 RepID=A0ABS4ST22_9PROT|nr:hypothetical protein [Azospirillum rugosum]MDQ0528476.1 hypothetical protein [Azospirillum rugosum]
MPTMACEGTPVHVKPDTVPQFVPIRPNRDAQLRPRDGVRDWKTNPGTAQAESGAPSRYTVVTRRRPVRAPSPIVQHPALPHSQRDRDGGHGTGVTAPLRASVQSRVMDRDWPSRHLSSAGQSEEAVSHRAVWPPCSIKKIRGPGVLRVEARADVSTALVDRRRRLRFARRVIAWTQTRSRRHSLPARRGSDGDGTAAKLHADGNGEDGRGGDPPRRGGDGGGPRLGVHESQLCRWQGLMKPTETAVAEPSNFVAMTITPASIATESLVAEPLGPLRLW